jgi:hypothetical protein
MAFRKGAITIPIIATLDAMGFKKAQTALGKFGRFAGTALAGIAAASAAALAKMGMDSIQAASDYEEALNKVNVIFGKQAESIKAFSDTASSTFGQSATQALSAASSFAGLGRAAGLQDRDLTKFATTLTVLASDLASFNNTSVEDAIQALGSGLRGEAEPLRRFDVLLNDATLRATALKMGLIETDKQALTPAQKTLASYNEILRQTKLAQGDFTNTSDGLANSQKTLTAVWTDLQREIGTALLPTFQSFVDWMKTDGLDGLTAFIDVLTGKEVTGTEWTAKNGKIERSLSPVQESFKNLANAVLDVSAGFQDLFETLEIDDPDGAFFTLIDGLAQLVKFGAALTRFGKGYIGDSFGLEDLNLIGKAQDLTGRLFDNFFGRPSSAAPNRVGGQTVINVNGTVLDPEGTARAINRVLTQSQRRAGAY